MGTEQEQKKKNSLISFLKRKSKKSDQTGKEKTKNPSEDVQTLNDVKKEMKQDSDAQKQGKGSFISSGIKKKTTKLKEKEHPHQEKTDDSQSKGKKTKKDQSSKTLVLLHYQFLIIKVYLVLLLYAE